MTAFGHGAEKYPTGRLLASSAARGWVGIAAELRSHPAGQLPTFTAPYTELTMLVRGRSIVSRRVDGTYQRMAAGRGTIWLSPAGVREDLIDISHDIPEALHIYLPANPFWKLQQTTRATVATNAHINLYAGVHDPLLEQIARAVLQELPSETPAGALLVETLADSLAARLLHGYSTVGVDGGNGGHLRSGLSQRRLRRVLDYIEAHLDGEITVAELAATASLSEFHFSRAFKAATGQSPHQYVTARRLLQAKTLLADGNYTLTQIAHACGFSSQANFSRAFHKATGTTPGRYRSGHRASSTQR